MGHRFAELAFTEGVKKIQEQEGSREGYARFEEGPANHDRLGPAEAEFLAARDNFYMATVSETGWPYVQHRGGPPGFVHVLDVKTIAFADFRGNRQFVSVGNLSIDNRVSLILVDYPNRRRLKVLGRVRVVDGGEDPALLSQLEAPDYRARLERAFVITVEAFDWNCPQHITPRFTHAEIEQTVGALKVRIAELEAALGEGAGPKDV